MALYSLGLLRIKKLTHMQPLCSAERDESSSDDAAAAIAPAPTAQRPWVDRTVSLMEGSLGGMGKASEAGPGLGAGTVFISRLSPSPDSKTGGGPAPL